MKTPKNKVLAFKESQTAIVEGKVVNTLTARGHQFVDKMASANIPMTFWKLPISSFSGSSDIKEAVIGYVKDIDKNYLAGQGLLFTGNYGIGKTYGLCSILKAALKDRHNWSAYYTSLPDLAMYATSKTNKEEYFALCTKSDFLVIDEMDARHMSDSDEAKAFFGSLIEKIIRERVQNKLPTFFGTNHDSLAPVFNGQHARAISSLLAPCTRTISALGQDYREKMRQE